MDKPNTREWPLVVFTVGLQLAAGIALVSAVEVDISSGAQRNLACVTLTTLLLAMSGSLFHVGRPTSAWRALTNFRQSRLTTELLACLLFVMLVLSNFLLLLIFDYRYESLNLATAAVGLAAVLTSARIYTLPAQPLWNSISTPSSFFGATLLLAGLVDLSVTGDTSQFSLLLVTVGGFSTLVSGAGIIRKVMRLSALRYRAPEALPAMALRHWVSAAMFFLGAGLPLLFVFFGHKSRGLFSSIVLLLFTMVGIAFGRALMYSRGLAISRF